jgi:tetratricopeptide (TPR) repeat protein
MDCRRASSGGTRHPYLLALLVTEPPRQNSAVSPSRITLKGRWRFNNAAGAYRFSAGPRDNYLELYQFAADAPVIAREGLIQLSDDVSLRRFSDPDGVGIAALQIITCHDREQDPCVRLVALVTRLHDVIPGLSVDEWPIEDTPPTPSEDDKQEGELHGGEFPTSSGEPGTSVTPDWLERAGEAVAQGRFKSAERIVHACAREDPEAAEFLEALAAVKRAVKQVRRHPRSGAAYLALAQAYFLAEAGSAALQAAERATVLDPTLSEAHAVLGWEMLFAGQTDAARARLELAERAGSPGDWTRALAKRLETDAPPASAFSRFDCRPITGRLQATADRVKHGLAHLLGRRADPGDGPPRRVSELLHASSRR